MMSDDTQQAVGSSLAEYKVVSEIGKGAYGVVYKVLSLKDGREYVLKKIPIKHLKKTEIQDVVKEAKILKKVDSEYIVRSHTHFVESGSLNIVMELAEGGDLHKVPCAHSAGHSQDEHVAIVDAIERRDARAAARLMDSHLGNVEKNLQLQPRAGRLADLLLPPA